MTTGVCGIAALVLSALATSATGASAQGVWVEGKEGDERTFVIQNERLRLVVFPDLGGRIGQMVDLADGTNLVHWDLGPNAVYHGEGGALDDRRNTFEQYRAELRPSDGRAHALRLEYSKDNVTLRKTISLPPGSATVRVDYVFENASQEDIKDYGVMIKNWFLPGGRRITTDDLYCLPTNRGVRRVEGFKCNFRQYEELRDKFMNNVGAWNGVVNVPARRGVAVAFSNDYLRQFYVWEGGVEIPTYEWVFGGLPAGRRAEVSFWIHVVRGMERYSHAGRDAVAALSFDAAASRIETAVFSAQRDLADARVETEVRRLPDEPFRRIGPTILGPLARAGVGRGGTSWKPEGEGTYVIRQRLMDGGVILAEYEEAVVVGKSSGEYAAPPRFPDTAAFEPLRGWKKLPPQDVASPQAEDTKRGYLVYLDEFAEPTQRGKAARGLVLDLGQGESKTFGFRLRALEDLKGVAVSLAAEGAFPLEAELFGVERVPLDFKKTLSMERTGEKLVPWVVGDMKRGEDRSAWIRLRSPRDASGKARLRVRIAPQQREAYDLVAEVTLWPVALPRPNLISLEAEHSLAILPGCWREKERAWNLDTLDAYARDLGEHLADFEQGFWGWCAGLRDNGLLRLATTGQPVAEYLRATPEPRDPPPIDFSAFNPVFDAAIRHGMIRFSANYATLPPKPAQAWIIREAARYLRDRGYPAEDIWCKYLDEKPATEFPKMVSVTPWLRENGYRPYSTFHNTLAKPEAMATLSRGFDMYQGVFTTRADRDRRAQEGALKPGDELWMYQGWGSTWMSYAQNRKPGWYAAATGLDGYHVHVYYRWHPLDAVIFPTPDGPVGSPAWEAMRDGMADAQYAALARRWIERLERSGAREQARVASDRLKAVLGEENSLVPLVRQRAQLVWVERLGRFDVPTAERARAALLALLAELAPAVAKLGPSLYYGNRPLAEQGRVLLCMASAADRTGTAQLAGELQRRFGVRPRADKAGPEDILLDVRHGAVPEEWRALMPQVTERYPAAGEYVICASASAGSAPRRLLIYGRDPAGLEKGIQFWTRFLSGERRGRAM